MASAKRLSSVDRLDPAIKAEVDRLIREQRHTIDQIVAHLRTLDAPAQTLPSRSALGRYKKQAESALARYRDAQAIAATWAEKLDSEPDGDVAKLVRQVLSRVALSVAGDLDERSATEGDAGEASVGVTPLEVAQLSKAMKDLASAESTSVQNLQRVRALLAQRTTAAADAVAKIARSGGLGAQAESEIRARILGIRV
jgi:hypothetical protein